MDPTNPVVKLCMEGMEAEAENRMADARALFERAWTARQDDFDACIAAHYMARYQEDPAEMLRWNHTALNHANAVADERVQTFYPSLCLNLGWSYEVIGDLAAARSYYALAAEHAQTLPAGSYTDIVWKGITAAQARTRTDVSEA